MFILNLIEVYWHTNLQGYGGYGEVIPDIPTFNLLPPTNCWKCQIYLLSFHFTLHKILANNTLPRFNTPIFGIFISNFYGRLICKPEQLSKELLSEFFLLSSRFERQWKMENRIQQPVLVNIKLSAKQRSWYQTSSILLPIHFI